MNQSVNQKMNELKTNDSLPYDKDFLKKVNPIKDDELIQFEEVGHNYHCYNPFFDKTFSKNIYDHAIGIEMVSSTGVCDSLFADKFVKISEMVFAKNYDEIMNNPMHKLYGCKNPAEVRERWSSAATEGTTMHETFEIYCNIYEQELREFGGDPRLTADYMKHLGDYYEIKFLLRFIEKFNIGPGKFRFFRTEMKMYDPVLHMTGTIDLLLRDDRDGKYVIVDWKRSKHALKKPPKKTRTTNPDNFGRTPMLNKVYNCSYNKYSLQLHTYKYILEKNYGFEIKGLYLAVYNPDKPRGASDEFTIEEIPMESQVKKGVFEYTHLRARFILEGFEESNTEPPKGYKEALEERLNMTC